MITATTEESILQQQGPILRSLWGNVLCGTSKIPDMSPDNYFGLPSVVNWSTICLPVIVPHSGIGFGLMASTILHRLTECLNIITLAPSLLLWPRNSLYNESSKTMKLSPWSSLVTVVNVLIQVPGRVRVYHICSEPRLFLSTEIDTYAGKIVSFLSYISTVWNAIYRLKLVSSDTDILGGAFWSFHWFYLIVTPKHAILYLWKHLSVWGC